MAFIKFIGKGLKDGVHYTGSDNDGKTIIEILKGTVGVVSDILATRLMKDYPDHFEMAKKEDYKGLENDPKQNSSSAQTPQDMQKEIKNEPKK